MFSLTESPRRKKCINLMVEQKGKLSKKTSGFFRVIFPQTKDRNVSCLKNILDDKNIIKNVFNQNNKRPIKDIDAEKLLWYDCGGIENKIDEYLNAELI